MCGIAGIVATDGLGPDDRERVLRMRDVLTYRGPDDAGLFADDHACLGHRRLSIVDLEGGHQPLSNEDASVWVAYNGEIYNHADVRRDLERAGHVYRTRSDTETIVHSYEEWGEEALTRFRGMFVFAVWDAKARRLLLARDRLGVKPLYWAQVGSRLVFASEIKAILASGLVEAQANERAFPELLSMRSIAGEQTMFQRIRKLMPGHVLWFARGRATTRRYWDIPLRNPQAAPPRTWHDDVRRFRELLEESIRLRLMSDVPLGVFLSGGVDSSAIAALMAPMTSRRIDTFSVAFSDRAANELEYARMVARSIGAREHEVVIDDHDFFGALPRLLWHEDEPMAHPSSVPLHFVSALARRDVKVVLTGEGSDELLGGYGRYPRALLNWRLGGLYAGAVPSPVRGALAGLARRLPGATGRYARRSFLAMDHVVDLAFFDNFAAVPLARQRRLLSPRMQGGGSHDAYETMRAAFNAPGRGAVLDRLLYADMKTYLVELLMKQDQMSMSASIESRVPFLDHHLVEFAAGLPPDRKLSGFATKRILRDAVRGVLPEAILRRPKMGFPVPFGLWLRGGWGDVVRDVLLDSRARQRELVVPAAVERLLSDARRGVAGSADEVWSLLNLELWHRTFIDGDGVQTLPAPVRGPVSAPLPNATAATGQER